MAIVRCVRGAGVLRHRLFEVRFARSLFGQWADLRSPCVGAALCAIADGDCMKIKPQMDTDGHR
ncbi:hypothetical protein [Scytonema sp. PRP1]|uniref:hypothetical protein n=1 Tax=Scytonema sp. PRP1 TaxID=3120513 RepID=UPI002FD6178B